MQPATPWPEMEAGKADLPNFVQDFVAEHSSSDAAAKPGDPVPGSFRPEAPKVSKSAASLNPHSVFLRNQCVLPDRLDPLREPCGEHWTLVEEITALDFRHHDPPDGLALSLGAPPLHRKRIRVHKGSCDRSEL